MAEQIKAFIKSLLKTEKTQETVFNYIFYISAASYLIGGIIDAISHEGILYFFNAVLNIIPLGCLYVACLFYIRNKNPMATTILASVFTALCLLQFVSSWADYRYYSFFVVFLDIISWLAAIGGGALLIIYQLKKNKYEETGKFYEYLLYAGIVYLSVHILAAIVGLLGTAINYGFVEIFVYLLVGVILQIPRWFLVLGIWLAVDLELERDLKSEFPQAETAAAVSAAIAEEQEVQEPAVENKSEQTTENNPKDESVQTGGPQKERTSGGSPYSRLVAILLACFLGGIGAHRFYVGKIKTGILMIVTLGGFGVWCLVDIIMIASGSFTDKDGLPLLDWQA